MKGNADGAYSNGAPGRARTCDLLIRSQTLYPTELRVHGGDSNCCNGIGKGENKRISELRSQISK